MPLSLSFLTILTPPSAHPGVDCEPRPLQSRPQCGFGNFPPCEADCSPPILLSAAGVKIRQVTLCCEGKRGWLQYMHNALCARDGLGAVTVLGRAGNRPRNLLQCNHRIPSRGGDLADKPKSSVTSDG